MNKWANSPGRPGRESVRTQFTSMKDYDSNKIKFPEKK